MIAAGAGFHPDQGVGKIGILTHETALTVGQDRNQERRARLKGRAVRGTCYQPMKAKAMHRGLLLGFFAVLPAIFL